MLKKNYFLIRSFPFQSGDSLFWSSRIKKWIGSGYIKSFYHWDSCIIDYSFFLLFLRLFSNYFSFVLFLCFVYSFL